MEKIQNSHLGQRSLDFLQKMKLIVKNEDGTMQASVSGILMASDAPETFLSNALIQTVCYRGTERTAAHQIDANHHHGKREALWKKTRIQAD